MARKKHYPRVDTTVCPDPEGCRRDFHFMQDDTDACECCGAILRLDGLVLDQQVRLQHEPQVGTVVRLFYTEDQRAGVTVQWGAGWSGDYTPSHLAAVES